MSEEARYEERRRWAWGGVLILVGLVLMAVQLGMLGDRPWRTIWQLWPAAMIVIGLVNVSAPKRPRDIASGITWILLGLWFFACIYHWYDLRFRTAWPLLLVIFGGEMVLAAVLERGELPRKEGEGHA